MEKLANISAFERIQNQANHSMGLVSEMSVFNLGGTDNFSSYIRYNWFLVDGLKKQLASMSEGNAFIGKYVRSGDFVDAAIALCELAEEGYPITTEQIAEGLNKIVGRDVSKMLKKTKQKTTAKDWLKESIAKPLIDIAVKEHGYRVSEGSYQDEEGWEPTFNDRCNDVKCVLEDTQDELR